MINILTLIMYHVFFRIIALKNDSNKVAVTL